MAKLRFGLGPIEATGQQLIGAGAVLSGALQITMPFAFQTITSTTGTNSAYIQFSNTGGGYLLGPDNSAGTSLGTGVAYAFGFTAPVGRSIVLHVGAANQVVVTEAAITASVNVLANAGAQVAGDFVLRTTGARWLTRLSGTETGGNAGSYFELMARADNEAYIDSPITIARAVGGVMTLARPVTHTTAVGFNGSPPLNRPAITGSRGGNVALAALLTQLTLYGLITDSTT